MTPVFQTTFGPTEGNCWQACLASVLDLPLDAVPEFAAGMGPGNADWWEQTQAWLATRGLCAIEFTLRSQEPFVGGLPDVPCIITCKSPRGDYNHAVVGCARQHKVELVHDPVGGELPATEWIHACFLAPIDPALAWHQEQGNAVLIVATEPVPTPPPEPPAPPPRVSVCPDCGGPLT
jgi:hypothetical protein